MAKDNVISYEAIIKTLRIHPITEKHELETQHPKIRSSGTAQVRKVLRRLTENMQALTLNIQLLEPFE